MAIILRQDKPKRKKVVTITRQDNNTVQNFKLLPKHMMPKRSKKI